MKLFAYTVFALVAFAANSILCRLALSDGSIDAASFTVVRLLSGAIVLVVILLVMGKQGETSARGSWFSAMMLFVYALTFSFAYITLDTGTGALILFGSVQITMIVAYIVAGNKLHVSEWLGAIVAFIGFTYLVLPGLTTPSLLGFMLMSVAGIAWGFYTLNGKKSVSPLRDTAFNFVRTIPLVLILVLIVVPNFNLSKEGVILAVLSGAVASGLGYTIWYMALGGLSATVAAVVQLLVPVIAAFGGTLLVSEPVSSRMILSGVLILGGILVVVLGRYYFVTLRQEVRPDKVSE